MYLKRDEDRWLFVSIQPSEAYRKKIIPNLSAAIIERDANLTVVA